MNAPLAIRPRAAALGFFAGVRAFFGGIHFVATTPGTWGWAAVPVVVATILLGVTGAIAIWAGGLLTAHVVGDPTSAWHAAGAWLFRAVVSLVALVFAFVLSISLAQPLSGFALDVLVRKQETALGGRTWPDGSVLGGILRSLRVTLTALALGLPVLALLALLTLLVPPLAIVTVPLKLVVTGLLAAYDFLDYPLSIRGEGVRGRLLFMRAHVWAVLGFGLSVAAVLLVPGLGLLVVPWGVCGATRLVVERDAGDRSCPAGP